MAHVEIRISTENAAFHMEGGAGEEYSPSHEVARILREAADTVEEHIPAGLGLTDYNGNVVGELTHRSNKGKMCAPTDDQRKISILEEKLEDLRKENKRIKHKLSQVYSDISEELS